MAITFFGKKYGGMDEDNNGIINTTIKYIFHFDGAESPMDIYSHASFPKRKSQHPSGKGLFLLHRSISEPEEGDQAKSGKYIVTAFFTNDLNLASDDELTASDVRPWKLPPFNISVFPIDVEKAFLKAYSETDPKGSPSVAVLNPAGDPFEATTVEQNTVLKFSYNLKFFSPRWIDEMADTVNASDMSIIDTRVAKQKGRIRNLNANYQRMYEEDGITLKFKYWQVDIEIEKQSKIWQVELMNLGYNFLSESVKKRIYTDNDGHFGSLAELRDAGYDEDDLKPIDTPFKLNANGTLYTATDGATYTTYNQKALASWSHLSIPSSKAGRGALSLLGGLTQ